MGRKVDGGIEKHQDLERFNASASDIAAKDQIDLMSRNWFSLTPNRTDPIEYQFVNLKTKQLETVRVTGSAEHGIATVHDQDLIIFVISQWIEGKRLGMPLTRRIFFTPYQFFSWTNIAPQGTAYTRLKDALHRLKTTNIETTIRSENKRRDRVKQFSWISEWETIEEDGKIRGVEIVLAEWLLESIESIQGFHVLTVDKRYFGIPGTIERWLYLYAKKATGGVTGTWQESFKKLYEKSASQQEYKYYAAALRKLVKKNDLPGLRLSRRRSSTGKEMLVMARTEKRVVPEAKFEEQLPLLELSPLEDAWENVQDILRQRLGEATANSWFKQLRVIGIEQGNLTYRAPTKFAGDWVESHYRSQLLAAWKSVGYEVATVRFEHPKKKSVA
jgi:plasmid replication initiation protein